VPVLVGIIAITIFFTAKSSVFFTAVNFQNLIGQMAGVTVIAVGIVFVLLIGEIDLSVGYLSGLCSVAVAEFQLAGSNHDYPGLVSIAIAILAGAAFGAAQGSIVAFLGVPSFVVTLAGLLIAQGLIIKILSTQGVIGITDHKILDVSNYVLSKNTGWIVAIVFTVLLALATFGSYIGRRRAGLPTGNVIFAVIRVVFFGGLAFAAVAVCNHAQPRPGVPLVGLIILFVVVLFSYLAGRTTFGRHVYAVGGNAEASRRAGINVKRIRILCFVISGALAGLGGVILASRLNSVDLTFGGGTLLLDSISAAVIGGVSLFGGRGKVSGALFGGLIIGMISNGTDLVGSADWVKYVTTGAILLGAVTLDTVARRRQAAAGR
jgi:D-xylose transport system permease protein